MAKSAKNKNSDSGENTLPASAKKFRQSPEIEGFYRFIYENDLRAEAVEVLQRIIVRRREEKAAKKAAKSQ